VKPLPDENGRGQKGESRFQWGTMSV